MQASSQSFPKHEQVRADSPAADSQLVSAEDAEASTAVESDLTTTDPSVSPGSAKRGLGRPVGFKLGDFLWAGSKGAVSGAGQALMVLFWRSSAGAGDTFKRKLVRLGDRRWRAEITSDLDDINHSIRYCP